jgi:hypothetical protein
MALASAKVGTSLPTALKVTRMSLGTARESWALGLSPTMASDPGFLAISFLMNREIPEWIPPQRPPSEVMAR